MKRKSETQLRAYGLDVESCDDCEWFAIEGQVDLEAALCIYHQGFVDGFDFARTIPPTQMPRPTTIKVVPGIPQRNVEKENQ